MRNLSMIARLYERITGTPYWTTRCVSAEFGPTPGAQYAQELAQFGDGTLMRLDQAEVLRKCRELRTERERWEAATREAVRRAYGRAA